MALKLWKIMRNGTFFLKGKFEIRSEISSFLKRRHKKRVYLYALLPVEVRFSGIFMFGISTICSCYTKPHHATDIYGVCSLEPIPC